MFYFQMQKTQVLSSFQTNLCSTSLYQSMYISIVYFINFCEKEKQEYMFSQQKLFIIVRAGQ